MFFTVTIEALYPVYKQARDFVDKAQLICL